MPSENNYFLLMQGNRPYIQELYRVLFPKIKHWIIQNNGSSESAADIFQEVLTKIITGDKKDIENLEGFIFQMCKFRWIDQLRKNNTSNKVINNLMIRHEIEDSIESQIIALEEEQIRFQVLETTFLKLTDVCQQLISKLKEGKKPSEIVNEMNLNSNNTFYRRKFACLDAWKKLCKEDDRFKNYIL